MASTRLAKLVVFLLGFLILFVILILVITTEPAEELLDGRDWSEVRGKISRLNLTSTVIEQYAEEKKTHLFDSVENIWCKVYCLL